MIIGRYLKKEIFVTLISLTVILLLIFMSNQFMRYLTRAASGKIPAMFIMKLMMLELPNLIGLLLPLGFFISLLLVYGRLYAESEMTVLKACGYGPFSLLKDTLKPALTVTFIVFIIMIWASPEIALEREKLLRTTGIQTLIKTIIPGQFREISKNKQVFYVEKLNSAHTVADNIFLARQKNNTWEIFSADKAYLEQDSVTYEEYVTFESGSAYRVVPGQADSQLALFKDYKMRLPHPDIVLKEDLRSLKTKDLLPLNNKDNRKAAELQWRLSIPLMVLALTFVAIPLSRVNTRSGKFAKLLPAIGLYVVYANAMFVMRNWLISGKIPPWVGMWWLHAIVIITGLFLIFKSHKRVICT